MSITVLIVNLLNLINNYLIPFLVALAILALFWGIVKYIWGASSEEGKADAVKIISAGIIGLVVMLSVWGIVVLVANSLGVSGSQVIQLPTVQ